MYERELQVYVEKGSGDIAFRIRYWDGIDKPHYTAVATMSIEQAEGFLDDLRDAIEDSRKKRAERELATMATLRTRIANDQAELARLEKATKQKRKEK